jgi:hypothetical protein
MPEAVFSQNFTINEAGYNMHPVPLFIALFQRTAEKSVQMFSRIIRACATDDKMTPIEAELIL